MKTFLRMTAAVPLLISPFAFAGENVPDQYGYIGGHASYYTFYDNDVIGNGGDGPVSYTHLTLPTICSV